MVLLVTKGFAQKPIEHINANGINKKNMLVKRQPNVLQVKEITDLNN